MTAWLAGMAITADATTISGLTASTGFSANVFSGTKRGGITVVEIQVNRTGADLVPTSGNIPDTSMCTLPSGWTPHTTVNAVWGNGLADGECTIAPTGVVTLRTANATITGTAGSGVSNVRVTGIWISENA